MARNLGAYVIGTGSGSKRDWVISLGANEFIDYGSDDFALLLAPDKVDLVLDLVGGDTGLESVKIIKPGGLLLQFPAGIDPDAQSAAEATGVGIAGPFVHIDKAQLSEIADQVAAGKIEVTVAAVYDLDRIGEAHRVLEEGGTSPANSWCACHSQTGRPPRSCTPCISMDSVRPAECLVLARVEMGCTCRRVTQLARPRHLSTPLALGLKAKADSFVVDYPKSRDASLSARKVPVEIRDHGARG